MKIFFISNKIAWIIFFVCIFFSLSAKSDSRDPFTGTVNVETGENVVDWERNIFSFAEKENEQSGEEESEDDENKKLVVERKESSEPVTEDILPEEENETELIAESIESDREDLQINDKMPADDFDDKKVRWGEYYGPTPVLGKVEEKKVDSNIEKVEEKTVEKESSMFPLDVILYSQGGDNYVPMINAGLKLSYWNIFSSVSIGTDFSSSLARPMGVNMFVGGFYRFWDISVNAALGYEKVWDFSDKGDFDNYSLGFKTGFNYHMLSWMSVSAGAGFNYCIMKESAFEEGKFVPMIFGGFEFSLIK
ncbi:MAG TPA: hypothetical protein ENN58_01560 [bacterium]|nr:hypothetical protein [bacterium]